VRGLQRFLTDSRWKEKNMLDIYRHLAGVDLGHPSGALVLQEAGFVKRGCGSAGAARQYRPETGKEQNCQVGLFCVYASPHGCCPVDKRLFIPRQWYTREFARKRRSCAISLEPGFRSKPGLAVEMLQTVKGSERLPFSYVVSDIPCGNSSELEDMLPEIGQVTYLLAVPGNARCLLREEMPGLRVPEGGQEPIRAHPEQGVDWVESAENLARQINPFHWYRFRLSEGGQEREYDLTGIRVELERGGLARQRVWLLIKRTLSSPPRYFFYVSNSSQTASLKTLAWLSTLAGAGRQCLEEAKRLTAMDQYETRKLRGWHRHMLLCMLANYFHWHLKMATGKESSGFSGFVE